MHPHKIEPHAQKFTYEKGDSLFFQGEIPRHGVMITEGTVRSFNITTSGEERTIAFFTKGDILPLSWLMGTTSTSLFFYEAVSHVEALQFNHEDFKKYVLDDAEALASLFQTITKDQTAAMLRINGLTQSRAEEKIAFTLYYLVFRYGHRNPDETLHTIDITLRHTTIAGLVGLSRESTTKILNNLQELGIIEYTKGTYRIHKARLEDHIGDDAFRNVVL